MRRPLVVLVALVAAALLGLGCAGLNQDELAEAGALHRLDDPRRALVAVIEAFRRGSATLFYYTLSHDVRRQYSYPTVLATWSDIDERLGADLRGATVLTAEYLDKSPFPPQPAARVAVEYPHPKGGTVVENFLFLLELDTDFREPLPQWRLYFPYAPYQDEGHTLWIRPVYAPDPNWQEPRDGDADESTDESTDEEETP